MTYPPPDGTPDPHRAPDPYQPPPAYDPTAVNPYPSHEPYQPSSPYQAPDPYAQHGPYGAQPSSVPYTGQPNTGQPNTGQPNTGQPYGAPQPQYGADPYKQYPNGRTNSLAIASLVCSLAGLVTCIGAPLGVVLGHIAKNQIRTSGEAGDSFATAGLIVGYVLSVLGLLLCVLWGIGAVLSTNFS